MAKTKREPIFHDPQFDRQCPWNDHGIRCQNTGSVSLDTHGGGPWYCSKHFFDLSNRNRAEDPVVMAEIDARVNDLVPRATGESEHDWSMRCKDYVTQFVLAQTAKIPNRDWARKILDREARGEPVSLHALLAARELVEPREPGEDDAILDRLVSQYGDIAL